MRESHVRLYDVLGVTLLSPMPGFAMESDRIE